MTESDVSFIPHLELRARVQAFVKKMAVGDVVFVAFMDRVLRIERKGLNSVDFRWATPNECKLKPEARKALNEARQLDGQVPTTCNDCLLVPAPHACWLRAQHNMKAYCGWMNSSMSRRKRIDTVKARLSIIKLEAAKKSIIEQASLIVGGANG